MSLSVRAAIKKRPSWPGVANSNISRPHLKAHHQRRREPFSNERENEREAEAQKSKHAAFLNSFHTQ